MATPSQPSRRIARIVAELQQFCLGRHQNPQMRRRARRQRAQIIAAFQRRNDAPLRVVPGNFHKLRGDPVIRKHYQFWFYSYPTGYPFPYSAAILRQELDAVEKRFPKMKPMVVIGHSMGGCISRLLLTDSGNKLWMNIFGRPPDEVPLSPQVREYFREELFFRHRPEIGRVIFIASPLRGSNLARGLIGSLAAIIIRDMTLSSRASQEMLRLTRIEDAELKPMRRSNSVDSLSPKSRFLNAMNTIPMAPGVPYNTIIGDRGRGDSPNSSDGVVPYWSSHMNGAQSEHIVPSGHGAHQDPQAIAEVLRILKANSDRAPRKRFEISSTN